MFHLIFCVFLDANVRDYIMLLKLYQATVTLYPGGYKQSLPPMKFIEKAIDIYQQNINDFPLKSALEHGLGGSDYILTGVKSKLGHFIGMHLYFSVTSNLFLSYIFLIFRSRCRF